MMKLKHILSENLLSPPDTLQFAKDRKYEEAWIISPPQTQPNETAIDHYLNHSPFTLMIAEFIWNSHNDDSRFVLTLFLDPKCQLQNPKKFIRLCLDLFYSRPDFDLLVNTLDHQVIGHPYLFQNPAESVNMSIFNHWLSVGPVELWQPGDKYNQKIIKTKIMNRPEIAVSRLNYQGLLFRFNLSGKFNGPLYGLKTPCCTKQKDSWVVDFAKIDHWLNQILGL